MELTQFRDWINGLNAMYLAGAGSVTLGATLILAAAVVQLRRLRARPPQRAASSPPVLIDRPQAPAVPAPAGPRLLESPDYRALLARLRAVADRLENAGAAGAALPAGSVDSPLKKAASGVDYIYRAGTG